MTDTVEFRTARERAVTGIPQEEEFRYSRGVRVGDRVIVSGSSALWRDGGMDPALEGDMYGQCKVAIGKIEQALRDLGSSLQHVVKATFFITEAEMTEAAAHAFRDFFGPARPAFTLVGVPFLAGPGLLVEIEAEAVD
jgi:enamine deaminase RidA (YjgF/YER057c/UK114 family)